MEKMTRSSTPLRIRTDSPESSNATPSLSPLEYRKWTGYHPVRLRSDPPSLVAGYAIIASSITIFCLGSYAIFFSAFTPQTGWKLLDALSHDNHYKYFLILLVPTTAYFVIANWVGWQYYRNS